MYNLQRTNIPIAIDVQSSPFNKEHHIQSPFPPTASMAAGFGCYSVAPSLNAWCVHSCWKTVHLAGPCELWLGFHHKTKAKVKKQANITSFLQQDILVLQEGMAGAKFMSYARTVRSHTSRRLYCWTLVLEIVVAYPISDFHPTS